MCKNENHNRVNQFIGFAEFSSIHRFANFFVEHPYQGLGTLLATLEDVK